MFPLHFRAAGDDTWPRQLSYGRYVHDVLLVNHGLAMVKTSVHVVEHVDRLDLGDTILKKLDDPIAFAIRLDDGPLHEIARYQGRDAVELAVDQARSESDGPRSALTTSVTAAQAPPQADRDPSFLTAHDA